MSSSEEEDVMWYNGSPALPSPSPSIMVPLKKRRRTKFFHGGDARDEDNYSKNKRLKNNENKEVEVVGVKRYPLRREDFVLEEKPFRWVPSHRHMPHPLLIPDVVANIVSRLDLADLRNCRLVCSDWATEVDRSFTAKGRIHLTNFKELNEFVRKHEDRHKFSYFRLGQLLNLQDASTIRFFNKFGSHIKYLHLDRVHWIPASLRKVLLEKLPLLEELVISSKRLCDNFRFIFPQNAGQGGEGNGQLLTSIKVLRIEDEFKTLNNQFLLDLLRVMPNLRLVTEHPAAKYSSVASAPSYSRRDSMRYDQSDIQSDRILDYPDPELIFSKIFFRNHETLHLPHIEHLKIVFGTDVVNFLRAANLPLKSLDAIVHSQAFVFGNPRQQHLFSCILSFRETLKSLRISYSSGRIKLFSTFDGLNRMRNLRHLTLHRVSGNLDFLTYLPQLKSLHMTQEDFIEYYDEFHIEECRPHKLESLKLYYTNWSVSSLYVELPRPAKILNVVQVVVQRFPHLKSLRMESLSDKALFTIYRQLPHLEELEATNGSFTSAGLSGIPVINQTHAFFYERKDPCIGDLKDLKKLRLESNKLSDYGITSTMTSMFLQNLKEITLICYKLTDEALAALVRRPSIQVIKTEFCYEFSKSAVNWASEILKARGGKALLNPFCGTLELEKVHAFLNENGPIHISIPDFPIDL